MTAKRTPLLFIAILACLAFLEPAYAQSNGSKFYSTQDGSFNTTKIWSANGHDGQTSDLQPGCEINGAKNVLVQHVISSACGKMKLNGDANITILSDGDLTVQGDLIVSGDAKVNIKNGGVLNIAGNITLMGSSVLNIDGKLVVFGNASVSGNSNACGTGSAYVSGSISGDQWCLGMATQPVELVDFSATSKSNTVALEWQTKTENNSDRFFIERSTNGLIFDKVTDVDAAGKGKFNNQYTVEDANLAPGTYYYRLTQVDQDGSEQRLDVVAVTVTNAEEEEPCELDVSPNPCIPSCTAVLDCPGEVFKTYVIDGYGRKISQLIPVSKFKNRSTYHIDAENFMMPGIYFIKAQGEDKEVTKKVMIK